MKKALFLSFVLSTYSLGALADACLALSASSIDALLPLVEATQKFNCNEPTKPLNSPNKEYFEKLLAKGTNAPLEEFLQLWDPNVSEFENDPYFFNCQKKPFSPMTKLDKKKHLAKECKPDVLYSWGTKRKLDTLKQSMPDNEVWKVVPNSFDLANSNDGVTEKAGVEGALFLALTPVVSFGYGDILVRVKVKKEIDFIPNPKHESKTKISFDTLGMHEFVINRSHMIESWSFGTPEIYDEMVRDIKRYLSGKRVESLTSASTWEKGQSPRKELNILYAEDGMDNIEFSEATLKRNLLKQIDMILKGEGKVIYNKEACRNYEEHYKTSKPTWFNPN